MKICFVRIASYFNEKSAHPENISMPMDIGYMASIAENLGHEVYLIDTEAKTYSLDDVAFELEKINAEVVLLKAKSPSNKSILELLNHPRVIVGRASIIGFGHTFSTRPQFFLGKGFNFHSVIHGEPEKPFEQILKKWGTQDGIKDISGISYFDGSSIVNTPQALPLVELDNLPSPKYEWFTNDNYISYYPLPLFLKRKVGHILSTRGCPMKCIYCSPTLRQTSGAEQRFHSVDRVVADLLRLQSLSMKVVMFRDDILTLDRNYVVNLCHAILNAPVKLKWMGQTHVNYVDEELLDLMKKAGCVTLGFGLESGSKEVLKRIKKYNDLDHARKIFKYCKKIRLNTVGFFLVGNPDETLEDIKLTEKLMYDLNPDLIQVAMFTPYAGSAAFDLLGRDQYKDEDNFHHYNRVIHNFSKIEKDLLKKIVKKFYLTYIFRPRNFVRFTYISIVDIFVNTKPLFKLIHGSLKYFMARDNLETKSIKANT